MNFMGMGVPELGVIFLVAFLVLGPGRAIDTARNVGKVLGDLRRSFGDVTNAMSVENLEQRPSSQADPAMQPLPGVPTRPETPSEDQVDQSEEQLAASEVETSDTPDAEAKG